jgi:hypothetical protein
MSISAIESMQQQYDNVIDDGIFSQKFILDPDGAAVPFNGVFDNPYLTENEDGGHVRQETFGPNIMVKEILSGFTRDAEIQVVADSSILHISKTGKDDRGVPVVWLY